MLRQEKGGTTKMNGRNFLDKLSVVSLTSQIILDGSLVLVHYCFLIRQCPGLIVSFVFLSVPNSHSAGFWITSR